MSFNNAYVLLIGVSAYRYISQLPKPATDAQDLYEVLPRSGYYASNIHILLNDEATKPRINDELSWLARSASNSDSTVIIFFSGHGIQQIGGFWPGEYLCPIEAKPDQNKDTLINNDELTRAIQAIRSARLIVFLDACHAGGIGELGSAKAQIKPGLSEKTYNNLAWGSGQAIIASCLMDEESHEVSTMRNGLFTHFLLRGLLGAAAEADGTIHITKLFGHIRQGLDRYGLQRPFYKTVAEDFVIAYADASLPSYYYLMSLEQTELAEAWELFSKAENEIQDRHCHSLLELISVLHWSTQRLYTYINTTSNFATPDGLSKAALLEALRSIIRLIVDRLDPSVKKFLQVCNDTSVYALRERDNIGQYLIHLRKQLNAFTKSLEEHSLISKEQIERCKIPASLPTDPANIVEKKPLARQSKSTPPKRTQGKQPVLDLFEKERRNVTHQKPLAHGRKRISQKSAFPKNILRGNSQSLIFLKKRTAINFLM
jgi:hypothetical protein